uniref:Ubiquitin-like domain-containing protein n=1 Tax=Biomphalaria glabrata TaxID=6526 RepID=A0A2C9LB33_BIOGL
MSTFRSVNKSRPDSGFSSMSNSRSSSFMDVDNDDSSQSSLTITASVSESPRLARKAQPNSASVTAKPGETVTKNIVKVNGELVSAPTRPPICQNGLNSATSQIATITIGEVNDQNAKPNGHCRPVKPPEVKPDPPKCFQIFVNNFADSRNYAFEVTSTFLVEKLMTLIQQKLDIPLDQQKLTYAGKNLERGMKLSHYNIREHSTIHLTARLRGG